MNVQKMQQFLIGSPLLSQKKPGRQKGRGGMGYKKGRNEEATLTETVREFD